jgi:hypothetical protein
VKSCHYPAKYFFSPQRAQRSRRKNFIGLFTWHPTHFYLCVLCGYFFLRFKGQAKKPSDENDKYGRIKPLDKSLPGMPEVVHENLKLAEVIEEIHFLKEQETADGAIEERNDR